VIELSAQDLHAAFGFGVAGNFAGHLEQAGEAVDFVNVEAAAEAPKGIFPWYVPGAGESDPGESPPSTLRTATVPTFLGDFPLSATQISFPQGYDNLQIEPEVGLLADLGYDGDGHVTQITPVAVAAFNDCSIRRPGANKISEKKNWGAASKGFAATGFPITDLSAGGPTQGFRLASFLVRGDSTHAYGVDSAVPDYSYYGEQLLDWIIERLAHQQGSPDTPLEPVGAYLKLAGNPRRVLIGIGATRYTPFGESTYLESGDDSVVVVYDSAVHSAQAVADAVAAGSDGQLSAASVLRQRVSAA
jgi:hypothetical protein